MSPLDKFTYGTFEIQASPGKVIRRTGHRLGPLAAINVTYMCPNCVDEHHVWPILNLASGAYIALAPVFGTVDDAAEFILDAVDLCDWPTADVSVMKSISRDLVKLIYKHKGFSVLLEAHASGGLDNTPSELLPGVPPGTLGFNGYTKQ